MPKPLAKARQKLETYYQKRQTTASVKQSAGAKNDKLVLAPTESNMNTNATMVVFDRKNFDSVAWWIKEYFTLEVSTVENSQREQRRDLQALLSFMLREVKHDHPDCTLR